MQSAGWLEDGKKRDAVWSRSLSVPASSLRSPNISRALSDWQAWNLTRGSLVGYGGSSGTGDTSSECPFVHLHAASGYYYLLRTQSYKNGGQTVK